MNILSFYYPVHDLYQEPSSCLYLLRILRDSHHTSQHTEWPCAIALFPGLNAQLLLLAVRKVGEGLDGFIT